MTVEIAGTTALPAPRRDFGAAVWRGLKCRCPACGQGSIFRAYLKVADHCPACGEELFHHEADDAPPYFTIFIVGHILVPLVLIVERIWTPAMWIHAALWLPLALGLSLLLLPVTKGAVVGAQWAMRMHGFADPPGSHPRPGLDS